MPPAKREEARPAEEPPARPRNRGGRRPGESGTREEILAAARASFGELGYAATTIRGIARVARVDPALVHYFFGTKDDLFAAAMALPTNPARSVPQLLAEGLDDIGERLVRFFLGLWDDPVTGAPLLAMIRSATSQEAAARLLREFVSSQLLGRIGGALERPQPQLRAALVGTQLVGLAMARYVVRIEPLATADAEHLVACVAPTVQRYLTGELPGDTDPPASRRRAARR